MVLACSIPHHLPEEKGIKTRLEELNSMSFTQLNRPVNIYWNDYMVPFIQAETDADAAFMMGVVHAHLRLGQMELGKQLAWGRLSEMAGPFTKDIDQFIRALNLSKPIPKMLQTMPDETKQWLSRYVEGINAYKSQLDEWPHDMQVLAIEEEPWTIEDTLILGRLGGVDVNWLAIGQLLPYLGTDLWPDIWETYKQLQMEQSTSLRAFRHSVDTMTLILMIKPSYQLG